MGLLWRRGAAVWSSIGAVILDLLAAAPAPATTVPAPSSSNQDYLYHLVRQLGGSDFAARTVTTFVVRPFEIVVVVILAVVAARLGSSVTKRYLRGIESRASRRPGRPRSPQRTTTIAALVTSIWKVVVWVTAVLVILETIGVNLTPLLAGATVLGAAIGFGAQSLIRDFLSGLFIVAEDQYGIGDTIRIGTTTGVVEEVSLRITRLRADDGTVWYVRNGDIGQVGNESLNWSRATVDLILPSRADLERAEEVVSRAAISFASEERWVDACLDDPEVLGVEAQDTDSLTIRVVVRAAVGQRDQVERELRGRIVASLREEGITPA